MSKRITITEEQRLRKLLIKYGAAEVMRCISSSERAFSHRAEASPLVARNVPILHECYLDLCRVKNGE